MDESHALARFAVEFPSGEIPADVLHLSARCLVDHLGVSIGGWAEPAVQISCRVAQRLGGEAQATLLGGGRTSMVHAATVNGIASHVLDFDDTHEPTILHGTGPVLSAALAAGEWVGVSGADLLAAHAVGFEVAARVALAVSPDHYDQGFHVTGTAGTLGAAAAAARILGLDLERAVHALSAAAAQAAGLREMFGSMSKSLHAGKAAANGLHSALLASDGWISAPEGLEGARGYWRVLSPRVEPERATAGLGVTWELHRNGQKPYACGVVSHPTIDAVRRLREVGPQPPHQVGEIRARVNPYVLELMGRREPQTGLQGKFSVYHCAAIAYLDGKAGVGEFTDDAVQRSDVVQLREKVVVEADAALPTGAATVRVVATNGGSWEEQVVAASGTPANPLTDDQLVEKLISLAGERLGVPRARMLADRALDAGRVANVAELMALLESNRGAGPGPRGLARSAPADFPPSDAAYFRPR